MQGERIAQGRQLDVTSPNMFAGSVLDLEPDTEYDVRFQAADPDGVAGERLKVVRVRTRAEPKPATDGRTFHVYPPNFKGETEAGDRWPYISCVPAELQGREDRTVVRRVDVRLQPDVRGHRLGDRGTATRPPGRHHPRPRLSSFLVATPAGHILIDSIFERTVPTIRDSVQKLGFRFEDIKIVLGSHAHGDHQEGDGLVVQMTGAKATAMAEDIPPLLAMRSPGSIPKPAYEALRDGSDVTVGGSTLTAHWTPGHTPGCTTWTMKVSEDGKTYDLLIIGSVGVNPGTNLVGNPALVAQYKQSFAYLKGAHVDVPLGSHPGMCGLADKFARLKPGAPNPYIDPQGFKDEVTIQETAFLHELERQQREGPPPPRGGGAGRATQPPAGPPKRQ